MAEAIACDSLGYNCIYQHTKNTKNKGLNSRRYKQINKPRERQSSELIKIKVETNAAEIKNLLQKSNNS